MGDNFKVEDIFSRYEIYRKAGSWKRYDDMFNSGVKFILKEFPELELDEKIKVIEALGEKIHNDVEAQGLRKGRALTFKERTRRWINSLRGIYKLEKDYLKDIRHSRRYDKFISKIRPEDYIVSAFSYNYLLLKSKKGEGRILLPNYSEKAEALIDLIFNNLAENWDYGFNSKPGAIITVDELEEISRGDVDNSLSLCSIDFDTSEMRQRLNVPYSWTDAEFVNVTRELREKEIIVDMVKIFPDDGGKLRQITLYTSICSAVVVKKTGKVAPRTKTEQHRVKLFVNLVTGLLFRNDIMRQKYSMFPTKKEGRQFYRMKQGVKRLYRYLSLWKHMCLTLPMAIDILGYSEKSNIYRIIKLVQGYLDELVGAKLIDGYWRPTDKTGIDTQWWVGVTTNIAKLAVDESKRLNQLA